MADLADVERGLRDELGKVRARVDLDLEDEDEPPPPPASPVAAEERTVAADTGAGWTWLIVAAVVAFVALTIYRDRKAAVAAAPPLVGIP